MGAESETSLWQPFEEGGSLGQHGSEGGVILRDDEHAAGARITLERDGMIAPFAVTCGIYGLFVHTAFATNEAEGIKKYEDMKQRLDELIALPDLDISDQLSAFVDTFT